VMQLRGEVIVAGRFACSRGAIRSAQIY
jgi:hypothetical protein